MQPEAGMECGVVSKLLWSRQSFAFFIDQPTFHIRPIFFSTTKCCNFGVSERLGVRLLAFRRFNNLNSNSALRTALDAYRVFVRAWVVLVYGIGGTFEKRLMFLAVTAGVSDLQSFLIFPVKTNDQRDGTPLILIISAFHLLFCVGCRIAVRAMIGFSSQVNPPACLLFVPRPRQA